MRRGTTTQVADSIPFDDSSVSYSADTVQEALVAADAAVVGGLPNFLINNDGIILVNNQSDFVLKD